MMKNHWNKFLLLWIDIIKTVNIFIFIDDKINKTMKISKQNLDLIILYIEFKSNNIFILYMIKLINIVNIN